MPLFCTTTQDDVVIPSTAPSLHGTVVFMACDYYLYTLTSCTDCTFGIIWKGQFSWSLSCTRTCSPEGFLSESGPCHWHVPHLAQSLSGPCVGLLLFPMESNPLQKFLGPGPCGFCPARGGTCPGNNGFYPGANDPDFTLRATTIFAKANFTWIITNQYKTAINC